VPSFISNRTHLSAFLCLTALACALLAQPPEHAPVAYITFRDARGALALPAELIPKDIRTQPPDALARVWPEWVKTSDAAIRRRLAQGEEDSLVNLLLFGTSFTRQPRMTARQIEAIINSSADPEQSGARLDAITHARIQDFVHAMAKPGGNDRLAFARATFERRGERIDTAGGQAGASERLLHELSRVLKDIDRNARRIGEARTYGPEIEFAERSKLYSGRGLSSDTSLLPDFAVEQALKAMRETGVLGGSIKRIAVIGPGLDFADKLEGYDFYPQQTLQPFALIDSVLRVQLGNPADLRVTTFDLSPRVNAHLNALGISSRAGRPYVLQLPLDEDEQWSADVLRYWAAFGDRIGVERAHVAVPPNAGRVKLRAVRIRPAIATALTPLDLNIVLQRLDVTPENRFDLIVGTNVFLYYDEFQQALAMTNIAQMLRPGGVLLSNNALVELPSSCLRYVGNTTVAYSARADNRDTIVWYQCAR
jgi:hypothetical protein